MQWILSFFSGEAHITYLLTQLEAAAESVASLRNKLQSERLKLEEQYAKRSTAIINRGKSADRLEKILSALS